MRRLSTILALSLTLGAGVASMASLMAAVTATLVVVGKIDRRMFQRAVYATLRWGRCSSDEEPEKNRCLDQRFVEAREKPVLEQSERGRGRCAGKEKPFGAQSDAKLRGAGLSEAHAIRSFDVTRVALWERGAQV
jgi:hypothetical protein